MKKIIFGRLQLSFLILIFCVCNTATAQIDRGVKNTKVEQKIALVIGNTNYDNSIGKLSNPVNDARDMAESLTRLGFTLVGGKPQMDVDRRQMLALIRDFGQQIKQGGIGFFYYSGHGVQVNKENYIIPITDALVYEDDAETEAVKIDMVAKEMELAGNRLNILVLDACRNNGLQKRTRNVDKGLAEPSRKPEGTFIVFSAGDGQTASDGTGKNGLFTQELLRNLETPNIRLDDIFRTTRNEVKRLSDGRQIPILYDSTSEAFVLFSGSNISPSKLPNSDSLVTNSEQISEETIFWNSIENTAVTENFRLYKQKYPNGMYMDLAELKLKQLTNSETESKTTPPNVNQPLAEKPLTQAEYVKWLYQLEKNPQNKLPLIEALKRRGIDFQVTKGVIKLTNNKSGDDAELRKAIEEAAQNQKSNK